MERDRQGQREFRGTIVCRSMQDNEIKATFYPSKVMFSPDPPDVQTMVNEAVDTAMEAAVKRTVLDELRKAGIAPQFQPAVSTLQEEIAHLNRVAEAWRARAELSEKQAAKWTEDCGEAQAQAAKWRKERDELYRDLTALAEKHRKLQEKQGI